MEESRLIKVSVNADRVCPYCNRPVARSEPDSNIGYFVSGSGRFKTKQYFHVTCFNRHREEINGGLV